MKISHVAYSFDVFTTQYIHVESLSWIFSESLNGSKVFSLFFIQRVLIYYSEHGKRSTTSIKFSKPIVRNERFGWHSFWWKLFIPNKCVICDEFMDFNKTHLIFNFHHNFMPMSYKLQIASNCYNSNALIVAFLLPVNVKVYDQRHKKEGETISFNYSRTIFTREKTNELLVPWMECLKRKISHKNWASNVTFTYRIENQYQLWASSWMSMFLFFHQFNCLFYLPFASPFHSIPFRPMHLF